MSLVSRQLEQRARTIDARPNEPAPVRAPSRVVSHVPISDPALAAVMSRVTELEARVTALEALVVSQRRAHAERQRRYRERKKQQPGT